MDKPIFLYAAGGHSKVVFDSLLAKGYKSSQVQVFDDDPLLIGKPFLSTNIIHALESRFIEDGLVHICIGNNSNRMNSYRRVESLGAVLCSVVHPSSLISHFAVLGNGVFIAARAVVAPGVRVGNGVIINHGAVVDHDCVVGDFCHIAPNATLGGSVKVGSLALVGAGAIVLPGVEIGECAIIGAGAVVTRNVPRGRKVKGIPAK